jgi:hypothetical protein
MGANNTEGAGAGLITTSARYELALASGTTTVADWRQLARALNRDADAATTISERRRLRRLADDCFARAAQLEQAVAA